MLKQFISFNANYKEFKKLIKRYSAEDRERVLGAFEFAKKYHASQKRDEGVPYIIHPVRVANILMKERDYYDPDVIIGALLHDVVEDSPVKVGQIGRKFGSEVKRLVIGMTRVKTRENKYIKFKKTMKADYRIRMIKCADVLDNVRSWPLSTKTYKFPRWFKEVREMYLTLAKNTDEYIYKEMDKLINSKKYKELLLKK
ncbi:HD domain-containing protein [Candidatus Saccharibacteria bacterium]|nr:bifunctional (p)ppGpp synthetase/guanosine-3',5'-bis(diphosphate) 3'-pyrophosphohydrolase [Candidatus Saccharibacteria bacterium]NIV03526.1 HD domain-containing protein [Calditrichia bacterium]NIS38071.1 bifunctional (p)ppGpp synthetase/guanosine-3',5'-bis(diphosphate) 3'-pyrophosphohydrolase [Candidatus Saccharibacteria bacterium]NIV71768.1 HD domain-containing protein [Calditrichia bacterium]NIV98466.1 HD domain-containing protein [Candidatus Saccharibacteria bacterium]